MFIRTLAGSAASALSVMAALVLDFGSAQAQTTLGRIREEGKVRVAVANEAPYGYEDQSGNVTGEGPEIARVVLEQIAPGVEIEWLTTEFGQLIPGLIDNQFDIAAAGMFITPERCEQVAFSNPTYVIGEAFAVKAGNPKELTSYQMISDKRDAKVGLIAGTVEYNYALVTGIPADRALLYRDFEDAIEGLEAGEVDAVGLTSLSVQSLIEGNPDLAATSQFYPMLDGEEIKGYGAFAFRKEDQALVQAFNDELASFLGSEAHWQLVEPFGFKPDMAPDMTAQILCAD